MGIFFFLSLRLLNQSFNDRLLCFTDAWLWCLLDCLQDIVCPESKRCCCFTKSYYRYVKGTGSLLATSNVRLIIFNLSSALFSGIPGVAS